MKQGKRDIAKMLTPTENHNAPIEALSGMNLIAPNPNSEIQFLAFCNAVAIAGATMAMYFLSSYL